MNPPGASRGAVDRRLRGLLLTGLSGLLATLAHLLGGGPLPDVALLAVPLPLLAWAMIAVADRCAGLLSTGAVIQGGQLGLHQLMSLLHDHPVATSSIRMLACQGVATALTVIALRYADRGIAAVRAALRRVLPRVLRRPLPRQQTVPSTVHAPEILARLQRLLLGLLARRGPPARC